MITNGGKWIENRTWNTSYRGDFLVHASATCSKAEYEQALDFAYGVFDAERSFAIPGSEELGGPWKQFIPSRDELQLGGIIGAARLTGVLPHAGLDVMGWQHGWRIPDHHGLILHDRRPLQFLPCKGALGFWGNFEIRDGKAAQR
jgi:hypothetical protein